MDWHFPAKTYVWVVLLEKHRHFKGNCSKIGHTVKRHFLSAVLACSIMPVMSIAQEASGLSLGLPLKPKYNVGDNYIRFQKDDWVLRCIATADGNDPCEMYQLIVTGEDTAIAELSMFSIPAGQPAVLGGNLIVPLETSLLQPMTIKFSDDVVKQYPFSYCTKVGCFVRIGLTQDDVDLMKKGDFANMTIYHMQSPNQAIEVPISLKGFTAVLDKLPKP
jgi:invasion protein IalB